MFFSVQRFFGKPVYTYVSIQKYICIYSVFVGQSPSMDVFNIRYLLRACVWFLLSLYNKKPNILWLYYIWLLLISLILFFNNYIFELIKIECVWNEYGFIPRTITGFGSFPLRPSKSNQTRVNDLPFRN